MTPFDSTTWTPERTTFETLADALAHFVADVAPLADLRLDDAATVPADLTEAFWDDARDLLLRIDHWTLGHAPSTYCEHCAAEDDEDDED